MLYQLSYIHHDRFAVPNGRERVYRVGRGACARDFPGLGAPRGGGAPAPARTALTAPSRQDAGGTTCFAAIFFAVSESGPGCGTKTASR